MIVFARLYRTDAASKKQFVDYDRWASRELPTETSAWRGHDPVGKRWLIVVADESDGRALEFGWTGEPATNLLTSEQVEGYARRRVESMLRGYLGGKRGRQAERIHYGTAAAPRLRTDGTWEIPAPQG